MDITKILKHSIELLVLRGEDITEYEKTLYDIDINRFKNDVITVSTKNITVFYTFSKDSLKEMWSNFRQMTPEDLFKTYNTHKFIAVVQEYPASVTLQAIQNKNLQMLASDGFLQLFLMKEMMYNPMKHLLVPKHKKLSDEAVKKLMDELQLKSKTQLPLIQRQDIIARWIGLQQGDIVRITRYNDTSGKYYYYRCCI